MQVHQVFSSFTDTTGTNYGKHTLGTFADKQAADELLSQTINDPFFTKTGEDTCVATNPNSLTAGQYWFGIESIDVIN